MAAAARSAVVVQAEDSAQLQAAARALRGHAVASAQLILDDGRSIPVPDVVAQALGHLVSYLAAGDDVTLTPFDRDYTTAEAALFLGTSRYFVEKLVADGELPATLVGTERRIAFPALAAYAAKMQERMTEGVRIIQQLSEEDGAYGG
jgi:excisionase family DNA binding protein